MKRILFVIVVMLSFVFASACSKAPEKGGTGGGPNPMDYAQELEKRFLTAGLGGSRQVAKIVTLTEKDARNYEDAGTKRDFKLEGEVECLENNVLKGVWRPACKAGERVRIDSKSSWMRFMKTEEGWRLVDSRLELEDKRPKK